MQRRIWLVPVALAALAACSSPAAPAAKQTVTVSQESLPVGKLTRTWTQVTPAHPDGDLLIVLHGYQEPSAAARGSSGADELATDDGVTLAYPDGFKGSWNAGTCCGDAQKDGLDDEAVVLAVAREIVGREHLDPHRVFVGGHSNGAFLALKIACDTSGVYAGFLSASGSLVAPCAKPGTASMVFYQGDNDPIVPVDGGSLDGKTLPPLAATLTPFVDRCTGPSAHTFDSVTTGYAYSCPDQTTVEVIHNAVRAHSWPPPTGLLVRRAWDVLAGQRAAAGVG